MTLIPTGRCWCRCGAAVVRGSFFAPGHDKKATAVIIQEVFGDVASFVAAFGYAPTDDLTSASVARLSPALLDLADSVQVRRQLSEACALCGTLVATIDRLLRRTAVNP